tara:strand:+ start:3333 stop:4103 length:771 start_codon:yes stop_codon:yes gene_type:complete
MIIINDIKQGTEGWFTLKAGVISASRADEFSTESKLAPMPYATYEKDGKEHVFNYDYTEYRGTNKLAVQNEIRETLPPIYGDMRQGYMAELVGQIVTGLLPDQMSFKQCDWGNEHEDSARALFELELGVDVEVPAFIYKDESKRCGISPDGLIVGKKIGLELKCPFTTKVFVEFAACDKIKKEYVEQCQYSMWVTGYEAWYFANYDPRIKTKNLHWVLIERDQEYMDKYDRAFANFKKDMDLMLSKLDMSFGMQWD